MFAWIFGSTSHTIEEEPLSPSDLTPVNSPTSSPNESISVKSPISLPTETLTTNSPVVVSSTGAVEYQGVEDESVNELWKYNHGDSPRPTRSASWYQNRERVAAQADFTKPVIGFTGPVGSTGFGFAVSGPTLTASPVNLLNIPPLTLDQLPPLPQEDDRLESCNKKWLAPKSWKLERHSQVCYKLTNSVVGSTFLLYVKPVCYFGVVSYELGIKQVFYPHIQTHARFNEYMDGQQVPVSAFNSRIVQVGKESSSLYLTVEGPEIKEYEYCLDATRAAGN